jgi:hypothetical protein
VIYKEPEAVKKYCLDWSEWLEGDTIATSAWEVPEGLTLVSHENTATKAHVKLAGGRADETYVVRNLITTAAADVRSVGVRVRRG